MTTTLTPSVPATAARREVVAFVVVQAMLGLAATAVAAAEGVNVLRIEDASALGQTATYGLALTPLVAAVAARLSGKRATTGPTTTGPGLLGFDPRGFGFRRVGWRTMALAWGVGFVPVLAAYAVVWITGVGRFHGAPATAALAGTVLVVPYLLLALAEDVGWRGLLVTRLAQIARPRTVYLVSGGLWSLSHLGLILFLGGTPEGVSPLYAAAAFTIATTALGSVLAAMQLQWGIWPGVVAHATVNAVLYQFADPSTAATGALTNWIATETGLAYAVAMTLAALIYLRWFAPAAGHQQRTSGSGNPASSA